MVAIVSFCMETLPSFERPVCLNTTVDGGLTYFMRPNYEDPFFIIETVIKFEFSLQLQMYETYEVNQAAIPYIYFTV